MVRIKITSKQTNGSAIINAEKKIIVFFIGGAGDKNSYYGYGPTKLVKNSILHVFKGRIAAYSLISPHIEYLGYEEIRGEDDIKKNVRISWRNFISLSIIVRFYQCLCKSL